MRLSLATPSTDFGAYLRDAREVKGVSLQEISAITKISVRQLAALERNEIARLPGGIFTRSFVRSYALAVGLDPDKTVQEFVARFPHESVIAGTSEAHALHASAEASSRRSAVVMLRTAAVLAIAAALGYLVLSTRPWASSDASGSSSAPASAPSSPAPVADPAAAPVPSSTPRPVESTTPPVATDLRGDALTRAAQSIDPSEALVIRLSPSGRCWIRAMADGRRVVDRNLTAGDEEVVRAQDEILLSVGDAGALSFAINDLSGRVLGKAGEVVNVRITRSNFKQFLAEQ